MCIIAVAGSGILRFISRAILSKSVQQGETQMSKLQKQAGFTLVELAIVMIIIGLLIAGVLKGQQLIGNAKVTSTVAQIKGIDGATSTFRDMYNALPGDLANANTRLQGCTNSPTCAAAVSAANGNGQLNSLPTAAPGTEAQGYFAQLALADLVTGVNPQSTVANCTVIGNCFPEAKAGNGGALKPGYFGGGTLGTNTNVTGGTYLTLQTLPNAATTTTASTQALTPNQSARIDTKVDDSQPNTGSVVYGGATTCVAGAVPNQTYAETVTTNDCLLFIRIQG
jgi:prepilin-type N-terminal cleavage/methylation domain-containing protein